MPAQGSDLSADPLLAGVPVHEGYKVLGGVVLYEKLGAGGMGAVYRGRHLRLDIDVAVKVMAPPVGLPPDQADKHVRRFLREARTAAAVKHPNLIRVYDVNSESGVHFIIMDYVDGESAAGRLKRRGRLSEEEAVEIALGAAEGLAAAHAQGIVHRDVKPDNILIEKAGDVVVADLGLAKAYAAEGEAGVASKVTETQTAVGTPHYMSPEQIIASRDLGPRTDVWSLGVTLYQLLTGQVPWSDSSVFLLADKIRNDPVPDPKTHCAGLSDAICAIMTKATRKDPAERYADCGEMTKVLWAHLDSIRRSDESVLPDAEAGATRLAVAGFAAPDPETMTLIGRSAVSSEAMARPVRKDVPAAPPVQEELFDNLPLSGLGDAPPEAKSKPAVRTVRRRWLLWLVALCALVLAVNVVMALLGSSDESHGTRPGTTHVEERAANDVGTYAARGKSRFIDGDLEGAIRDYDKALELRPSEWLRYLRRGVARAKNGDVHGAGDDFRQADKFGAGANGLGIVALWRRTQFILDHEAPIINEAIAKRRNGDLSGAIRAYDRLIERDPSTTATL